MPEEYEPPTRQLSEGKAWLLSAFAGVLGGAAGMAIGVFVVFNVLTRIPVSPLFSFVYFIIPADIFSLPLAGGLFGAMLSGVAVNRLIARYEGRPAPPKFRDPRTGGAVTTIIKVAIWAVLIFIFSLMVALVSSMGHGH